MHDNTHLSETAFTAAAARAAHLIVDRAPLIFADTLAAALLGDRAEELLAYHRTHGGHPVLASARTQVTCRSRYTEDRVAESVHRGTSQYVILGAGLDSFAYRSAWAGRFRVFEVDHPATQEGKRARLAAAGIPIPDTLSFVPFDFETGTLAERLRGAGFDPSRPAVVSWLGVTMYLTSAAIEHTLAALGGFAAGTELVVDYMLPEHLRDEAGNAYAAAVMPVAAQRGEPWLSFLAPDRMTSLLRASGFRSVEHLDQRRALGTALWDRTDSLRPSSLSMLAHATLG